MPLENEISRRLADVEEKLDVAWDSINRHIAGCEKLGIAAVEQRERMERSQIELRTRTEIIGSELTVKLDRLLTRMSEQDGALKTGKVLYASLGVIIAGLAWAVSHIAFIR